MEQLRDLLTAPRTGLHNAIALVPLAFLLGALLFVFASAIAGGLKSESAWNGRARGSHRFAFALTSLLALRCLCDLIPFPGGVVVEGRAYFLAEEVAVSGLIGAATILACVVALMCGFSGKPWLDYAVACVCIVVVLLVLPYPFVLPTTDEARGLGILHKVALNLQAARFMTFPFGAGAGLFVAILVAVCAGAALHWPKRAVLLAAILLLAPLPIQFSEHRELWQTPAIEGSADPTAYTSPSVYNATRALDIAHHRVEPGWLEAAMGNAIAARDPALFLRCAERARDTRSAPVVRTALRKWSLIDWTRDDATLELLASLIAVASAMQMDDVLRQSLEEITTRAKSSGAPEERIKLWAVCAYLASETKQPELVRGALEQALNTAVELEDGKSRFAALEPLVLVGTKLRSKNYVETLLELRTVLRMDFDQLGVSIRCVEIRIAIGQKKEAEALLGYTIPLIGNLAPVQDRLGHKKRLLDACVPLADALNSPELRRQIEEARAKNP